MKEKDVDSSIDFMVEKFQETIKKFDTLTQQVSSCMTFTQDLSSKQNISEKKIDDLCMKLSLVNEAISNGLQFSREKHDNHSNAFIRLALNGDSTKKEMESIQASLRMANIQIEALQLMSESYATSEDLTSVHAKITDHIHATQNQFTDQRYDSTNLKKDFVAHCIDLNSVKQDVATNKTAIDSASVLIGQYASHYAIFKNKLNEGLASLSNSIDNTIDQKIAAIPKSVIPSIDETTKAYQTQLEPVKLDASNAKLRSSNCEAKITLLEKKVEQLQLLLNRYQLQG